MRKIYSDATTAMAGLLKDGMTIMAGGFGLCGIPETLIEAVRLSGVRGLTVISNNAGIDGIGLGRLLETRQIFFILLFQLDLYNRDNPLIGTCVRNNCNISTYDAGLFEQLNAPEASRRRQSYNFRKCAIRQTSVQSQLIEYPPVGRIKTGHINSPLNSIFCEITAKNARKSNIWTEHSNI